MAHLTDGELESIANSSLQNAVTYADSGVSEDRALAYEYFLGKPYGNEVAGRSSVVTRDVLETVLWTMPSLMRIFMGGDDIVKFEPRNQGDEEAAEQATETCNYVFRQQNNGFEIFHDQFMDALIQKNGVVKVYWDARKTPETLVRKGLRVEQVLLLEGDGWRIKKSEKYLDPSVIPEESQAEVEAMVAADPPLSDGLPYLYDVTFEREQDKSQVRIYNVPPEEFLVSRGSRGISDDEGGVFHRKRVTLSDLIAEGYPKDEIAALPSHDEESEYAPESIARYESDDAPSEPHAVDEQNRKVWVTECYIRVDMDGDGITELRKVTIAGGSRASGSLLAHPEEGSAPEVDVIPFASVCPIPLPHRYHGLSLSDIVMDLQLIHSTV